MTSNRILSRPTDYSAAPIMDRLALSRAQHFQSRENRPKSVSDDEVDAVSDWSDSDQECCPLSDFESNIDDEYLPENKFLPNISQPKISPTTETPLPIINDSTTSTRISFTNENEKPKEELNRKSSVQSIKSRQQSQTPLLPARRIQTNSQLSNTSRYRKIISPSPTRLHLCRETTSTSSSSNTHLIKDSSSSSFHSHDDNQNSRPAVISPNLSQTSVPRVYEIKKIFVDDYDYGRLTSTRTSQARGRQKWGTIVHPPFPLGYQQVSPEHVTHVVERLSSPVRCRERHTPIQAPSKRYLSVEETEALVKERKKTLLILSFLFSTDKSINKSQNHPIPGSILASTGTKSIYQKRK